MAVLSPSMAARCRLSMQPMDSPHCGSTMDLSPHSCSPYGESLLQL